MSARRRFLMSFHVTSFQTFINVVVVVSDVFDVIFVSLLSLFLTLFRRICVYTEHLSFCSVQSLLKFSTSKGFMLLAYQTRGSSNEATYCLDCLAVWPDWAIYWTMGKFLKPLAIINLSKSSPFLGNFCKGVKIYHFSSEIIFEQLVDISLRLKWRSIVTFHGDVLQWHFQCFYDVCVASNVDDISSFSFVVLLTKLMSYLLDAWDQF